MTIKSIVPEQSIRLHKGAPQQGTFSWVKGISMRELDSSYNTPFLRRHDLLKLNKDGVFMTRTLAENYPYSKLYKAKMRGSSKVWPDIVEALEDGTMQADVGLSFMMILLKAQLDSFNKSVEEAMTCVEKHTNDSFETVKKLLIKFYSETKSSARAFEVVLHGFMQAMKEEHQLGNKRLNPMTQMRTANKKHGNIGDIELRDGKEIVEAWDAKYGKPYLRDELEELNDKIMLSPKVKIAGFVVDKNPDLTEEMVGRMKEISSATSVTIKIFSFEDWLGWQITGKSLDRQRVGYKWLKLLLNHLDKNAAR